MLPLGLEQNLPWCGLVGDTGVSLWGGGESAWNLGGWGGARDARTRTGIREERLEHRGFLSLSAF